MPDSYTHPALTIRDSSMPSRKSLKLYTSSRIRFMTPTIGRLDLEWFLARDICQWRRCWCCTVQRALGRGREAGHIGGNDYAIRMFHDGFDIAGRTGKTFSPQSPTLYNRLGVCPSGCTGLEQSTLQSRSSSTTECSSSSLVSLMSLSLQQQHSLSRRRAKMAG